MEVYINTKQARELAKAIKNDIFDYIQNNQESYKKFLEAETRRQS